MTRRRWIAVAVLALVAVACLCWGDGWSDPERRLFVRSATWGRHHAALALLATEPGYAIVLVPLSLLFAGWLARARGAATAAVYLAGTLLARLSVEGLKDLARRPRPALLPHLAPAVGWSFPSGHAANSTAVLLGFALVLRHRLPSVRPGRSRRTSSMPDGSPRKFRHARHMRWMVAAVICLSLAIGASRVLLAVHWPSDVLAGWAIGAAAAILIAGAATRFGDARSGPAPMRREA